MDSKSSFNRVITSAVLGDEGVAPIREVNCIGTMVGPECKKGGQGDMSCVCTPTCKP